MKRIHSTLLFPAVFAVFSTAVQAETWQRTAWQSYYQFGIKRAPIISLELDEKKILNSAMRIAAREERTDDLKRLLKQGADVNSCSDEGETALIYATKNCTIEAARILIRHHANVNQPDSMGRTALIHAAMGECVPIVELLVRLPGTHLKHRDRTRRSALDYARLAAVTEMDGPASAVIRALTFTEPRVSNVRESLRY